ncbi:uncharacterized protein AAEQ78_017599 [Lycaon pictus]
MTYLWCCFKDFLLYRRKKKHKNGLISISAQIKRGKPDVTESTGTHQLCISHPIVLLWLWSSCQSTSHKVHSFDLNLTLFDKASCRCSSWRQQITDNTMLKKSYLLAMDTLKAISFNLGYACFEESE